MLPTDKQARKERPIARGFLDYFPDAVAAVAHVSFVGNQQHNPGQELHWAREKSNDHADCVARHLIERGTIDDDGVQHTAKAAWRIMALLQLEIENQRLEEITQQTVDGMKNIPQFSEAGFRSAIGKLWNGGCGQPVNPEDSDNAWPSDPDVGGNFALYTELDDKVGSDAKELTDWLNRKDDERHQRFVNLGGYDSKAEFLYVPLASIPFVDENILPDHGQDPALSGGQMGWDEVAMDNDFDFLLTKGCDPDVAEHILNGTTYQNTPDAPYVYISGPMRGYKDFNFPEFDKARDYYAAKGYNVISPADIDRSAGLSEGDQSVYVYRDFYSLLLVAHRKGEIAMMGAWTLSVGASAEFGIARWLGIKITDSEVN